MQETEHAGIRTLRYVPPENAMGAHDDPNPDRRNPDNECFCMAKEVRTSLIFSVFAFSTRARSSWKKRSSPVSLVAPQEYVRTGISKLDWFKILEQPFWKGQKAMLAPKNLTNCSYSPIGRQTVGRKLFGRY